MVSYIYFAFCVLYGTAICIYTNIKIINHSSKTIISKAMCNWKAETIDFLVGGYDNNVFTCVNPNKIRHQQLLNIILVKRWHNLCLEMRL